MDLAARIDPILPASPTLASEKHVSPKQNSLYWTLVQYRAETCIVWR